MSKISTFGRVLGNLNQLQRSRSRRRPSHQTPVAEGLENRVLLSAGAVTISVLNTPVEGHNASIHVHLSLASHPGDSFVGVPFQIDWGDGTGWQALADHGTDFNMVYSGYDEGSYLVSGKATATWVSAAATQHLNGSNDIDVVDGALTPITTTLAGQEDTSLRAVLLFSDAGGGGVSDFTAGSIDWGDGSSTAGGISTIETAVTGTHTYTSAGTYNGSVTVNDVGGGTTYLDFTAYITETLSGQPAKKPKAVPPDCHCTKPVKTDPGVDIPIPSPSSDGFSDIGQDPSGNGSGLRPSLSVDSLGGSMQQSLTYFYNTDGSLKVGENGPRQSWGFDGDGDDDEGYLSYNSYARLTWVSNGSLVEIDVGGGNALYFNYAAPNTYTEYFGYGDTLVHKGLQQQYILTTTNGTQTVFYDDSAGILAGQIQSVTDAYGNSASYSYNGSGMLTQITQANTTGGVTTTQEEVYSYTSGALTSILLKRQVGSGGPWTNVQSDVYTYYGSGSSNGNAGDLETATTEDGSSNVLNVDYYRWWTGTTSVGGVLQPPDTIKYFLSGPSYAQASAGLSSGTTVLTATDAQLAPYADDYIQYDSDGNPQELIQQGAGCSSCSGGQGTFTYGYTINSSDPGNYNSWFLKVSETMPDSSTDYFYYNEYGQIMLSVLSDGNGNLDATYTQYSASGANSGQPVLVAQPSAVNLTSGLSSLQSTTNYLGNYDLVGLQSGGTYTYLNSSAGLISTTSYYTSTTATSSTAGGVNGYVSDTYVKQGYSGTAIHQENYTYYHFSATINGVSVPLNLVAADTVYGDIAGTDARTTSYAYTLYSSTVLVESETVTYPTISSGQNGPGSADTESTFFDTNGRPIWTEDGDGHVNYTSYDIGTGAITETIIDVNYASLSAGLQSSFSATGWSNPSGLNLDTVDVVDDLGRVTEETSPNGNVTYTVYNDPNHEVRVYPGFVSGATTGPIQIYRTYYPSANSSDFYYTEMMTSSATPHLTSSVPDGTETLSAANIQSLERDFYSAGGQVIWSDKYFDFTGITYSTAVAASGGVPADLGTSGTDFYRTIYGYDADGRQSRVLAPTGTISRTVYDAMGRVVSEWIGTDDTPGSGSWSPSNNTSPSNMMDLEDDVYDSGGSGDSNLTQVTDHVDTTSGDDRVTQYLYDFRDRQVAEKDGIQSSELPTFQLAAAQTIAAGAVPVAPAVADVNGDGKPDIVVANYSSSSVSVLLGNGDGTFQARETFTTISGPFKVVIADVNNDGKPDLIVGSSGTSICVLLGNGNGTFQAMSTLAVGSHPRPVAVADLNGDGKPDIIVGNYYSTTISVLMGNGNGTFQAQQTFSVGGSPDSFTIADVNADGKADVVVANELTSGTVTVLLGNGNGTFQAGTTTAVGNRPRAVAVADVNGDGKEDVVVANYYSSNFSVLLGNGNGTFHAQTTYASSGKPTGLALVDLNHDGNLDIVGANYVSVNVLSVLLGNGNGTFSSLRTYGTPNITYSVVGADVNGDGLPDLVVSGTGASTIAILLNQTPATFTNRPLFYNVLDNQGETVRSYQYDGDGVPLSDFSTAAITDSVPAVEASQVRALTVDSYDDQGRVYRSQTFNIDQTNGTSGLSDSQVLALPNLATDSFYDHRGDLVAVFSPGGIVTKSVYDGAGRIITQYLTDGGAVNNSNTEQKDWTHATSVSNDVVLQETDYTYDYDGNVTLTETKERFDNDSTGSKGALGSPGSGIGARDYFVADYYDAADRPTDDVNVGTDGGSAYTRPGSVPSPSDTVLVSHTDYDAAGNAYLITDPRGSKTQYSFDMLGRTTQEIDGASGSPASGESITNWTYDGDNNIVSMQAVFPGTTIPSQTTMYIYAIGSTIGTDLFSNDLIAKVEYPDKTTGSASSSASNDVSYTYDLLGEPKTMTDQNGNVHTYTYDALGRLTLDAVTTLGSGVDGAIRALGYTYNGLGLPYRQSSYSDSAGTTLVSQVQDDYNGYGQMIDQYQEHSGAVNAYTSLKVLYTYGQPSGADYSRLTAMTYPNGRVLDYVYNSGIDTNISRVSGLSDDSGTGAGNVQSYTYLGLGTIVQELDGSGVELTYIHQSGDTLSSSDGGDQYTGLDRFGRVIDQFYVNTSGGATVSRVQYGYDRDGNVLYADNLVKSTFSELYHANSSTSGDDNTAYDNLNRLTAFRRGTLSASANNSGVLDTVSTLNANSDSSQTYTLDAVGNQTAVNTDGTNQTNTVNSQNEETGAGSNTLVFDNNGNTTTDDQGHTLVYDAWNRLVAVKNGATTLAAYAYDANGNRIQQTDSGTTTDLYNSVAGQVLEERHSGTVVNQYVWSIAYVNALVLRDDNSSSGSYGESSSGLGRRLYVQQDADFNVTALTNTSGVVQQRFVYTPYGLMTVIDATTNWSTTTDAYSWVYTFQGGRSDPATGMIHFGAREYSPSLERWVQKDPDGYVNGANIYQFEVSDPSSKLDPSGLKISITGTPADVAATENLLNYLKNLRGSNGKPLCVSNMVDDLANATADIHIIAGPYGIAQDNVPTTKPTPGHGVGSTVHFDPRYKGALEPESPADPAATLAHELEHAHQNLGGMRNNRREGECDACQYENEVKKVGGIPLRKRYTYGPLPGQFYPIVPPFVPPGSPTTQPAPGPTTEPSGPTTRPVAGPPTPSDPQKITVPWP